MTYTVIFRQQARDEAVAAAEYISLHASPETALAWYEALHEAIRSLKNFPLRCALARENDAIHDAELRQLVFKSYRIIFTVRSDAVHVLHLRHASMDRLDSPAS